MSDIDPAAPPPPPPQARLGDPGAGWRQRRGGNLWGGGILILVGLYFLLANLGLLDWLHLSWDVVWPVILIVLGAWLVVRRLR